MYVYTYICMHGYMHICVCVYAYICIYIYIYIHIHIYMFACMQCVKLYCSGRKLVHTSMYTTCMHIRFYTHVHVHYLYAPRYVYYVFGECSCTLSFVYTCMRSSVRTHAYIAYSAHVFTRAIQIHTYTHTHIYKYTHICIYSCMYAC